MPLPILILTIAVNVLGAIATIGGSARLKSKLDKVGINDPLVNVTARIENLVRRAGRAIPGVSQG